MKLKQILLLAGILCVGHIYGQSVSSRINEIKRDGGYIYDDITATTEDDAYKVAYIGLMDRIKKYIDSSPELKSVEDSVINIERINTTRGSLARVFLYVKASDITPIQKSETVAQTEVEVAATTESAKPAEDVAETAKTTEASGTVTETETAKPTNSVEPVENNVPTPQNNQTEEKNQPVQDTANSQSATTNQNVSNVKSVSIDNINSGWQREVIKKLVDAKSIVAAQAHLSRMKSEFKIRKYGSLGSCSDLDNSWLIVFEDDGDIVAVLGAESDNGRPDYLSGTFKSLKALSGLNAIWFIFA